MDLVTLGDNVLNVSLRVGSEADSSEVSRIQGVGALGSRSTAVLQSRRQWVDVVNKALRRPTHR